MMTHPLDINDSAQLAMMHLHTARNIKRLITVNPRMYDTPQHRLAVADQVHMARLHNHKAVADLRQTRK